ncbi:hypothetical protein ACR79B_11015 [Sphingobacterium spiritivorum]|uniref:hypothetical protein n=1 Tax=Sphingobacterium spiritivorum TaxID=258 RepID=UPI003DA53449
MKKVCYKKILSIVVIVIIATSCEQSFEAKFAKIQGIEEKYRGSKLVSTTNIIGSKEVLDNYLKYLQIIKGNGYIINVPKVRDSLYNVLLTRNNINIEQLKIDTAKINSIIEGFYKQTADDKIKVTRDIGRAFSNDLNRNYDDVIFYIEKGYFKNGVDSITSARELAEALKPSSGKIEKWMSGWDGSIRDFVSQVKSETKDPTSFKHIQTSYKNKVSGVIVRMKFSANNSYNARITNVAEGILNVNDGTVSQIKIIE